MLGAVRYPVGDDFRASPSRLNAGTVVTVLQEMPRRNGREKGVGGRGRSRSRGRRGVRVQNRSLGSGVVEWHYRFKSSNDLTEPYFALFTLFTNLTITRSAI
ncbi:hypothetical protein [Paenibacillus sp. TSA_86.1]|uniref:hypothetical protein n=1 Tax=Paenibacillus sp. TSA_86.1 TaxID=3415649 RepID=UPI0040454956